MTLKLSLATASILFALSPLLASTCAQAQAVEVQDGDTVQAPVQAAPQGTGKERAGKYFQKRESAPRAPSAGGATPRYLAVHVGRMFADSAYNWGGGDKSQKDVGGFNAGVTYRVGEWVNSMDLNIRMEYTSYSIADNSHGDKNSARKLSFGTLVTFPDANSRFPLYFGAGLGLGVFIKQLSGESPLALDYSLVGGARFLDVFENVGFMIEAGLKNHVMLDFNGQYNGVFVNVGSVFAF